MMQFAWTCLARVIVFASVLTLAVVPLSAEAQMANPNASAADVEEGERLFRRSCSRCHGVGATGGEGPNLTLADFRYVTNDESMFRLIGEGISYSGMPAFGVNRPAYQRWQLVAYVRSVAQGRVRDLPGDPASGEVLFEGVGGCPVCHMVNGKGGRQAPDLSEIGRQRSPEYLRTAILDPSADVLPRWWTYEILTPEGESVIAHRMNEDSYSIRTLDGQDNMRALEKDDMRSITRLDTSLMPALEGQFTDAQVDDLVAYLRSLRGER